MIRPQTPAKQRRQPIIPPCSTHTPSSGSTRSDTSGAGNCVVFVVEKEDKTEEVGRHEQAAEIAEDEHRVGGGAGELGGWGEEERKRGGELGEEVEG